MFELDRAGNKATARARAYVRGCLRVWENTQKACCFVIARRRRCSRFTAPPQPGRGWLRVVRRQPCFVLAEFSRARPDSCARPSRRFPPAREAEDRRHEPVPDRLPSGRRGRWRGLQLWSRRETPRGGYRSVVESHIVRKLPHHTYITASTGRSFGIFGRYVTPIFFEGKTQDCTEWGRNSLELHQARDRLSFIC